MKGEGPSWNYLIAAFVILFIGAWVGWDKGLTHAEREAIKAGVAHYTVNPQTGETKFEYLTPKP